MKIHDSETHRKLQEHAKTILEEEYDQGLGDALYSIDNKDPYARIFFIREIKQKSIHEWAMLDRLKKLYISDPTNPLLKTAILDLEKSLKTAHYAGFDSEGLKTLKQQLGM